LGCWLSPASTKVSSNASTELPICHLKQAKKKNKKKQDDERKKQKTHAKKKQNKYHE